VDRKHQNLRIKQRDEYYRAIHSLNIQTQTTE